VVEGLGSGPFLTLDEATGAAVAADGRLLVAGATTADARVGPTLGALWPQHLAASTALPPGKDDALLVFAREANAMVPAGRVSMPGPVRALATRPREGRARVVAAVVENGENRLLALELSPLAP